MNGQEPVPGWIRAGVRRAAFWRAAGEAFPVLSVVVLLACVNLLWVTGNVDSAAIPVFWNVVFVAILYFIHRDLVRALRDWADPGGCDEVAYLRRLGPLAATAEHVAAELADPANVRFGREATFTRSFVILSGGARFAVRRLEDLVWVYPKELTTKLNFAIPLWRSRRAILQAAGAPEAAAKVSKEDSLALVAHALERCPWIVAGYTEEAAKAWDASPDAFAAEVLKRKPAGR